MVLVSFSGQVNISGKIGVKSPTQPTLFEAIITAGLTSGLQFALDAGDSDSYSGSGQKWLDTSGNGQDFFLGVDATASNDPTFNGIAGGQSPNEFWLFGSSTETFFYDTSPEAWMGALHLNNASFTFMTVIDVQAGSGTLAGSRTIDPGIEWQITSGAQRLSVRRSAGQTLLKLADTALTPSTINFITITVDEAAGVGGGFYTKNGAFDQLSSSDTWDATYTSPGGAAGTAYALGTANGPGTLPAGSKMYMYAAWDTALTKIQIDDLFTEVRDRFSL